MSCVEWEKRMQRFEKELHREEKSRLTIDKYMHDVRYFCSWLQQQTPPGEELTRDLLIDYKQALLDRYRVASANSMIVALNRFLRFCGMEDLCLKTFRVQRQYFRKETEELTKEEYLRLTETAERMGKRRLRLLMQTLACTGIRVRELSFVTADSIREGRLEIFNKGKWRVVYLPRKLREELLSYCSEKDIRDGPVFLTAHGHIPDRISVWRMLKRIAVSAGISEEKVYPHNFRHLFACTYYGINRDIAHLADLLGHADVETTRRYTLQSADAEEYTIEKMGLI